MNEEEKEFTELYDKYYITLRNIMRKIVSDTLLAEDIAQETFLRIWEKVMWRENGFFSLMIRIGTNICYDHFRWEKRHRKTENYILRVNGVNYEVSNPEYKYLFQTLSDSINDAIENGLTERRREIFKYRIDDYLTSGEIAESLSISKRTVENHVYMARSRLKDIEEVKEVYFK